MGHQITSITTKVRSCCVAVHLSLNVILCTTKSNCNNSSPDHHVCVPLMGWCKYAVPRLSLDWIEKTDNSKRMSSHSVGWISRLSRVWSGAWPRISDLAANRHTPRDKIRTTPERMKIARDHRINIIHVQACFWQPICRYAPCALKALQRLIRALTEP